MANICCDDVIFYTEGNPEGLYDLWEDLETYIIQIGRASCRERV